MNSVLWAKVATGAKPTTIVVKQSRCFSICSLLALESQTVLAVVARTVKITYLLLTKRKKYT